MKTAQFLIQREHAPPDFWPPAGDETMLVDGVELESSVPTRFFQIVDPYPSTLGRLQWRIALNKVVDDRAALPFFRSHYSGVEWNLTNLGSRWFLTAWFRWELRSGELRICPSGTVRIEGDTAIFSIPVPDAAFDRSLYLRSRVDARDRRSIANAVETRERAAISDSTLILLDDIIDST